MIIELQHIHKTYSEQSGLSRHKVLDDISLSISAQDAIAVIGPSGSGKTTLLNIIGTLDKPDSGILTFGNENLLELKEARLAEIRNQKIGFVFQWHHLLPQLNLIENVLLPTLMIKDKKRRQYLQDRAMYLLEKTGLQNKIKQLPGQLSGGESQRAAVVRALINEPEIILADEPTGSLDQEAAAEIGSLLSDIHKEQQVALLIVTHSQELAGKMDRIYRLNQGKLLLHQQNKSY
ncbi:MAG: ABC transporter ATP-binding protein [Bacteroidetes bacterium]|nr:ABC transporter ATP-binding protein [Bacteroidota bacterium]